MKMEEHVPQTIDEYIAGFPGEIQATLMKVRQTIHEAAPEAQEKISYAMPTFFLKGNLVHFAAFKHHIGFYPAPTGILEFRDELAQYEGSKGAIRFPLDKPVPYDLIGRIVRFRVKENLRRAEEKRKRK
jgi:uncharacterized protein YdhG (YjbR/CyaY superfamily)